MHLLLARFKKVLYHSVLVKGHGGSRYPAYLWRSVSGQQPLFKGYQGFLLGLGLCVLKNSRAGWRRSKVVLRHILSYNKTEIALLKTSKEPAVFNSFVFQSCLVTVNHEMALLVMNYLTFRLQYVYIYGYSMVSCHVSSKTGCFLYVFWDIMMPLTCKRCDYYDWNLAVLLLIINFTVNTFQLRHTVCSRQSTQQFCCKNFISLLTRK